MSGLPRPVELSSRAGNEAQYRVFAEGYVDQLELLRADVDDYLRNKAPSADAPSGTPAPRAAS